MDEQEKKSRRRRPWGRIILAFLGGFVCCLLLVAWIGLRTPGWYQPATVPEDREQRQEIRNNLVMAEQAFTGSLLDGRPFKYRIHQRHINEWLAMRYEIYPRIDDVVPPVIDEPFVTIGDGHIRLAGRLTIANQATVVSADIAPSFEDGDVVLRLAGFRCGSLPLPNVLEQLDLDRSVQLDANRAWPGSPPIEGRLAEGIRIGARGWWQNGGVDYEVTDVEVGEGVLTFSVTPLERQARNNRH